MGELLVKPLKVCFLQMRLRFPTPESIEQGAIFNCALVAGYEDCECTGIILTARCDLAHSKQNIVNYLPVVRFSDWIRRDFSSLLAKQCRSSIKGYLASKLREKKLDGEILDVFPISEIIAKGFVKKEKEALILKLEQLRVVEEQVDGDVELEPERIIAISPGDARKIIKELIAQRLSGYYFLNSTDITEHKSEEGWVVLLRQMQSIPTPLSEKLAKGIKEADADNNDGRYLKFDYQKVAMITGVLRSPDIEHLAQCFVNLFARIGLEDQEQKVVDSHCQLVKI